MNSTSKGYKIVAPHFTSTHHRTEVGSTVYVLGFREIGPAIFAANEEEAIKMAKKLGFINPILERIKDNETTINSV